MQIRVVETGLIVLCGEQQAEEAKMSRRRRRKEGK
jgi:hypothetical protein